MGLKIEKMDKIRGLFYEFPREEFTVRKISRRTKLPKSTVQKYLLELKNTHFVTKENRAASTQLFKTKKICYFLEKIIESGLVEYLEQQLTPDTIILFGSIRKGESEIDSDIDLYVETSQEKELDLIPYEKKLKHPIQLFIKEIKDLPPELKQNIINGIKLSGFLRLK